MTDCVVILITVPNQNEAGQIAEHLLEHRLVACVNIVPAVNSLFWWQGQIDRTEEVLLIAKSRGDLVERVVSEVVSRHSYDVPEILALPVMNGHPDYLRWVKEETV